MNAIEKSRGRMIHTFRSAVAALVLLACAPAGAQSQQRDFSADVVHTVGKKVTNEHVYSSDKAVRIEKDERGKHSITIMRLDRKAVWVVMPDQKAYMDMGGLGEGAMELSTGMSGAKTDRQTLGSEQVGPYHCEKFRVQTTYEGHIYTGLEWDAKELGGFPVKQADEKGSWSKAYQNVKLGAQDPSLFEIPAGYRKLDLGGMFKQQQ